jgi:AcrR family transcriptional regulator
MSTKARLKPRKSPTQDRARATVDAILEATAHLLVKEGFDRTTTNRVAEAAGVSIGSLYQYFPSKDALVAALLARHVEEMRAATMAELARVRPLPITEAVRAMVELMLRAHAVDPALHRVLMEQVPRPGRTSGVAGFERDLQQLVVAFLEAHRAELRPRDLEQAAFLVAATVESLTHAAVLYQPQRLRDPAFVDEVCAMVTRYLLR